MAANGRKRASKASSPSKKKKLTSISTSHNDLSDKQWFRLALFCTFSSIFLYANTLKNEFVFDDMAAVVNNSDVTGESSIIQLFQNDFWAMPLKNPLSNKSYRPLTTLSFRMTAALHGMSPMAFHCYNVLLNCIACYLAVRCIQCLPCKNGSWTFGVVTCLLYTFHPIHSEVVATVVGRADLLAAMFALQAFLKHSKCIKNDYGVSHSTFVYCLILSWLSALSKETGLMVLGVCGAAEVATIWLPSTSNNNNTSKRIKYSTSRFIILALTGVVYLLFRKVINGSGGILPSAGDNPLLLTSSRLNYALTALVCMCTYMWRLVHPFVLLCDYGYNVIPIVERVTDVRNVASLGLIAGVLALTTMAFRTARNQQNSRLLLALAWMILPLLPASHILTLGTVVAERLLFVPSLGYCMLIGLLVERLLTNKTEAQKKNFLSMVLVVILALYTRRILSRNDEWSTEEKLWAADYKSHPRNVKIASSHADTLMHQNKYDAAYHVVKDLQGLGDVQQFELCKLQAKATALSDAAGRDFDKAYAILDACVEQVKSRTNPSQKDHLVYAAYGYLLSQQERFQEAAEWFGKASNSAETTGVNPLGPICNQGEILARLGQWQDSVPVLQKCVELSTKSRAKDTHTKTMNVAKALYMTKQFDRAEDILVNDMPQTSGTLDFLQTVRNDRKKREEWLKAQEEKKAESTAE